MGWSPDVLFLVRLITLVLVLNGSPIKSRSPAARRYYTKEGILMSYLSSKPCQVCGALLRPGESCRHCGYPSAEEVQRRIEERADYYDRHGYSSVTAYLTANDDVMGGIAI